MEAFLGEGDPLRSLIDSRALFLLCGVLDCAANGFTGRLF